MTSGHDVTSSHNNQQRRRRQRRRDDTRIPCPGVTGWAGQVVLPPASPKVRRPRLDLTLADADSSLALFFRTTRRRQLGRRRRQRRGPTTTTTTTTHTTTSLSSSPRRPHLISRSVSMTSHNQDSRMGAITRTRPGASKTHPGRVLDRFVPRVDGAHVNGRCGVRARGVSLVE